MDTHLMLEQKSQDAGVIVEDTDVDWSVSILVRHIAAGSSCHQQLNS